VQQPLREPFGIGERHKMRPRGHRSACHHWSFLAGIPSVFLCSL
jgi:hypothetical protein